jgi:16S rRNA (guanine527-N7)-methyltransferase
METPIIQTRLEKALERAISHEQIELLMAHLRYIIEQNNYLNLTRIGNEEQGLLLHIEDSLTALPELDLAPEGTLVDMGSGGGFPGIPLAIMGKRPCVLVEKTGKKAAILQKFITANALEESISVKALRAEELAREQPARYAVVVARALSSLPSLMELASPLLQRGGILVAYKGQLTDEEKERGASLSKELGMVIRGVRALSLSDGLTRRTIVQIEKVGEPKRKLPRKDGQAQSHPLA